MDHRTNPYQCMTKPGGFRAGPTILMVAIFFAGLVIGPHGAEPASAVPEALTFNQHVLQLNDLFAGNVGLSSAGENQWVACAGFDDVENGDTDVNVYVSENDGVSWTIQQMDDANDELATSCDVAAVAHDEWFVAYSTRVPTATLRTYHTTDGGASYVLVDTLVTNEDDTTGIVSMEVVKSEWGEYEGVIGYSYYESSAASSRDVHAISINDTTDPSGWQAPVDVAADFGGSDGNLDVAVAGPGEFFIIYAEDVDNVHIVKTTSGGAVWSNVISQNGGDCRVSDCIPGIAAWKEGLDTESLGFFHAGTFQSTAGEPVEVAGAAQIFNGSTETEFNADTLQARYFSPHYRSMNETVVAWMEKTDASTFNVRFARSTDHAETWTKQTVASGTSVLIPRLAIDRDDGDFMIGVVDPVNDAIFIYVAGGIPGSASGGCASQLENGCGTTTNDDFAITALVTDDLGQFVFAREERGSESDAAEFSGRVYRLPVSTLTPTAVVQPCRSTSFNYEADMQSLSILDSGVIEASCAHGSSISDGNTQFYFAQTLDDGEAADHAFDETLCFTSGVDPPCFYSDAVVSQSIIKDQSATGNHWAGYSASTIYYLNPFGASQRAVQAVPSTPNDLEIDQVTKSAWFIGDFGIRAFNPSGGAKVLDNAKIGNAIEVHGNTVVIGGTSGVFRYTFSSGTLLLQETSNLISVSSGPSSGLFISRDGDYLVHWQAKTVSLYEVGNLTAPLFTTVDADNRTITSAVLDVANNYLFTGNDLGGVVRWFVAPYTTSFGEEATGDTNTTLNPVPSDPDQTTGSGDDFGAPQNPAVSDADGDDTPTDATGQPAFGQSFAGVSLDDSASAFGITTGAFGWFLGAIFVLAFAAIGYQYTGSGGVATVAGIVGQGAAIAFGLLPLWSIVVTVAAGAGLGIFMAQRGG